MVVISKEEEARRAGLIYDIMLVDQPLIDTMEGANKVSVGDGQVEHGWAHALNVGGRKDLDGLEGLTWYISNRINALRPGSISLYEQIKAGAAGLLHDSGRSIAVKDHDKHSARLAHAYLLDLCTRYFADQGGEEFLPKQFRKDIVRGCRMHRADSWLYKDEAEKAKRKKEITDIFIALLLLADKLCGSEARVPEKKLRLMKRLASVNVGNRFRKQWNLDDEWTPARISWGHPDEIEAAGYSEKFIAAVLRKLAKKHIRIPKNMELDHHDQVNGSIEDRIIEIFADERLHEIEQTKSKYWGTMLYRLKINEGMATQQLVTGLDWWHEAFHVSAKAAKALGLRFSIEFNGHTITYDRLAKNWVRVEARHA